MLGSNVLDPWAGNRASMGFEVGEKNLESVLASIGKIMKILFTCTDVHLPLVLRCSELGSCAAPRDGERIILHTSDLNKCYTEPTERGIIQQSHSTTCCLS